MTTASKTFAKKGVYHSELVRETDPNGLSIILTGKPRESQDGKSWYVYFKHENEDHYYTIENDAIKTYLEQCPTDQAVTIHAFGSREAATITVEDDVGAVVIDGQPTGKRAQGGPPPLYPEDEDGRPQQTKGSPTGNATGDLYLQCLLSARKAHEVFIATTKTPASDDDIRIATTMFINASR